jgi:amino acid transporter
MTDPTRPADLTHPPKPTLRRVLTFWDLVLYYSVTGFSLRWIATAAAAGPSALVIWIVAALGFFVPLVFTTLELSSRYPEEGGIYIWSKRAFGPFAGFITGWTYWGSNLPYLPGLLYFAAANALFIGGPAWQAWSSNSIYFIVVATVGLAIAVTMNVVGLNVGKWLNNVGAIASWIPAALLIGLGVVAWRRFGSATPIDAHALLPSTSLKDVIFWSTIAFAFGGVESASTMGDEIKDARWTVPRAILAAGALITVLYIAGTLTVLVTIPKEQVSGLQGIMQAVQAMTTRVGLAWLIPIVAALVTLNALGGVGGWFAATARLPFVAGLDRFLPPAFGALHPTWRTPYVALLVQAAIAAVFVFLGQAGTSVRGAYDALVSMGIIAYFLPFLFMFAAMIVLQREPAGPDVIRVPGGKPVAIALAAVGFVVTAISIVLACVPPDEEPNKMFAVVKVVGLSMVLVGVGVVVYILGRRRAQAIATIVLACGLCGAAPLGADARRVHRSAEREGGSAEPPASRHRTYSAGGLLSYGQRDRGALQPRSRRPRAAAVARQPRPSDRRYQSRQISVRGDGRGERPCAVLTRLQLDLRRVGDDGRSQGDASDIFGVDAHSRAGEAGPDRAEEARREERLSRRLDDHHRSGGQVRRARRRISRRRSADHVARERRSGGEARPPDPRRRLHGARTREVRA